MSYFGDHKGYTRPVDNPVQATNAKTVLLAIQTLVNADTATIDRVLAALCAGGHEPAITTLDDRAALIGETIDRLWFGVK